MRKPLCLIAAFGIAALGQGVRVDHQVTSTIGAAGSLIQVIAIPNALTYVCSGVYTGTPCTSAGVTVYADAAMTEPITQPMVADGQGNITNDSRANGGFYVASLPIYWTTTPPQGSAAGAGSTTVALPGGGSNITNLTATHPAIIPTSIEQTLFADQYHASGSAQQTTGTISASSSVLSLAQAQDFANAEGIQVVHAGAAVAISAPAAPTLSVTGSGTTTCTYSISALDGNGGQTAVGASASTTVAPSSLNGTSSYITLSWTPVTSARGYAVYGTCSGASPAPLLGVQIVPSYYLPFHASTAYTVGQLIQPTTANFNGWVYEVTAAGTSGTEPAWCTTASCTVSSGGATFTAQPLIWSDRGSAIGSDGFYVSPQIAATAPAQSLADSLITTISSGGGTASLTLAAAATVGASGAVVLHDDTAAIQAAINASAISSYASGVWFLASSQPVVIPRGQYLTSSVVSVPQYVRLRGSDQTIVQETTPTAGVLTFSDVYSQGAENLTLIGGADQVVATNADVDNTNFYLSDITFNSALDYAIKLIGDGSVDLHMSMQATLERLHMSDVRRTIWSGADIVHATGWWVEDYADALVDANTALGYVYAGNPGGSALATGFQFNDNTLIGPQAMQGQRWFDNYGAFYARGTRWGGEAIGGIPAVYQYSGYGATPYFQGGALSISESPALDTDGTSCTCVIRLFGVPNQISLRNNASLNAPFLISVDSSLNLPSYLNAARAAGASFYFSVSVNGLPLSPPQISSSIPADLIPFLTASYYRYASAQPTAGLWSAGQYVSTYTTFGGYPTGWLTYRSGQAAPAWQASHAYALGAVAEATVDDGHVFIVTTAGTSGGVEPTWNTGSGATTTDGSVVWTEAGASAGFQAVGFQRYSDGTLCLPANATGSGCSDYAAGVNTQGNTRFYEGLSLASGQTFTNGGTISGGTVNCFTCEQSGAALATTAQLSGSGNVTTTSGTSDPVAIAWPDGGARTPGHCSVGATNTTAATNISTTYISAKASNAVTLTHTATANMTYDVTCTVN